MSDSVQPYSLLPARLLCPSDSPGKNTGVRCYFLLWIRWWQLSPRPGKGSTKTLGRCCRLSGSWVICVLVMGQDWRASPGYTIITQQRWLKKWSAFGRKIDGWLTSFCKKRHQSKLLLFSRCSCVRLFATPMDCSVPGSSIHGILLARILEWAAMPSSRGWTLISCLAGGFFTTEPPGKP